MFECVCARYTVAHVYESQMITCSFFYHVGSWNAAGQPLTTEPYTPLLEYFCLLFIVCLFGPASPGTQEYVTIPGFCFTFTTSHLKDSWIPWPHLPHPCHMAFQLCAPIL